MSATTTRLQGSIQPFIRRDFVKLDQDLTVEAALACIRASDIPQDGILYLYVVDEDGRLMGVLPVRKLLTAAPGEYIKHLMTATVAAITQRASVFDACEMFLRHKYLAFPVVDDEWRLAGRIDVSLFTEEIVDLTERQKADGIFELLGFRVSQIKRASPWMAWKLRFPWLLATIASGTACAFLAGAFEETLAKCLILTFFLTLVLAVGESVSIQAMTVTIQRLRFARPEPGWFFSLFGRDMLTGLLISFSCGAAVAAIVGLYSRDPASAAAIGSSVCLSLIFATVMGHAVPAVLHGLKLDPKVAAGPLTLAITDLGTLFVYFALGTVFLAR
jgi:magnesium transporter